MTLLRGGEGVKDEIPKETKLPSVKEQEAREIVNYYYTKATKIATSYRAITESKKHVLVALKKYTKQELIYAIDVYAKGLKDVKYMVTCAKLFNKNSGKDVNIEDFIGIESPKAPEKIYYDDSTNMDWTGSGLTPPE